jgi:uroporphyrinogen decarboxylase
MNSLETIESLFKNQNVQRMGLKDGIWADTLLGWVKQGYPTTREAYIDDFNAEARYKPFGIDEYPADTVQYFNMDMARMGLHLDYLPKKGYEEIIEESDEWVVKRNGAGADLKYWKHKSGTPEHIAFHMNSREVWETEFKPHLLQFDISRLNLEDTRRTFGQRRAQGLFIYTSFVFVWEIMRLSLGDVCLYESMLLEPEWIHDIARTYTDFFKKYLDVMIEQAGKPDGIWLLEDLGYNKGLFCSPKTFDALIFPYHREMVEYIHGKGIAAMLHSCGNVTEALDYIVDMGFDLLNPMEAKAGNDLEAYAKKYKDKLVFWGGFDVRILESGDTALIRKEVKALLENMKRIGARYIFATDHSVSTGVSLDSFQCAVDTFRENMYY